MNAYNKIYTRPWEFSDVREGDRFGDYEHVG